MRNHLRFTVAAAVTAGVLSPIASGAEDDKAKDEARGAEERVIVDGRTYELPAGIERATEDDSEDIRDALAAATEAACKKDGFDTLVARFVDADRNRLGKFTSAGNDRKLATLNGRIDQLRKDWRTKYNEELDLKEDVVFGPEFRDFFIAQGQIANPALLSDWPVKNRASTDGGGEGGAEAKPREPRADRADSDPGDRNLEKGRDVAVVVIPAGHGAPEVVASLIQEVPDSWKIDVPDHVDGQRLHDQLLNHLTKFSERKDEWPEDANEAYRAAAHHVLLAIYDVPAEAKAEQPKGPRPVSDTSK